MIEKSDDQENSQMKNIGSVMLLGLFIFFCSTDTLGQKGAITNIDQLGAMAGCWERKDAAKSLLVSEQWMRPAGTSMIGMGRTVRGGKTVDHEFMRIEQRADGIYFVAKPSSNKEETAFKIKSSTSTEVVFENPEHDFPQRVIYKFSDQALVGRIEGTQNGKAMGIDFPFVRVKCD